MSAEKSELKAEFAGEIGQHMAAMLKAAQDERLKIDGYAGAIIEAGKSAESVFAALKADVEAEKLTMEVANVVAQYLKRVMAGLENLATRAQSMKFVQDGVIAGVQRASVVPAKVVESEKAKAQAIKDAEKGKGKKGPPKLRAVGTHPGNPLADRKGKPKDGADA